MTIVDIIKPNKQGTCRCYFCECGTSVRYIVEPIEEPSYAPLVYACESCVISFLSDKTAM